MARIDQKSCFKAQGPGGPRAADQLSCDLDEAIGAAGLKPIVIELKPIDGAQTVWKDKS